MTTMLLLVKDHLRRNWRLLILLSLLLFCMGDVARGNDGLTQTFAPSLIAYVMVAYFVADSIRFDAVRVWRTLPFRSASLATLAWSMIMLAPPLIALLNTLPAQCLGYRFGTIAPRSMSELSLYVLLFVFSSGLISLASALHRFLLALSRGENKTLRGQSSSTRHPVLLHLPIVGAGALLFFPTPTQWSDLGLSHLAGMCLATGLTWKSYQMRSWLLEPAFGQDGRTLQTPSPEGPAFHSDSVWNALARDLRNTAQQTILSLLVIVGFCYAVIFCVSFSGLLPNAGDIKNVSMMGAGICILVGIKLIFDELDRTSMLGVVHSLPLTANQSVLLLLSYPYAASLAALPCMALSLWLAGVTHILIFLLAGALHSAALCPLGMFILGRFGPHGLRPITMVGAFLVIPGSMVMSSAFYLPTHWSPQILVADILTLATLGLIGYYGLRHLLENSSDVYKRKLFPQQFGQGVGR